MTPSARPPMLPCSPGAQPCTRRQAILGTACLGASALLTACGAERVVATDGAPEVIAPDAYAVVGDVVVVRLDKATALRAPDSALVIGELQLAIVRVGESDYRAFSNVCTHAGCGIFLFTNNRLRCQCHGSEFDVNGTNVVGPALEPLPRYSLTLNAAARELRVKRG